MSTLLIIIILAIIQGATEILPVSSSAHLVIFKNLLEYNENGIGLEIALHIGTLLAIIVFWRKDILDLIKSLFSKNKNGIKYILMIIVASIPAGIIGIIFKDKIEMLFSSSIYASIFLIINGILLYFYNQSKEKNVELNYKNSFVIGIFQAIAILPGISRSGSTVGAGLIQGIKRSEAFTFSFLLSIPAIFGATVLEFKDNPNIFGLDELIGIIVAFIVGYISLKLFSKIIKTRKMYIFSIYCILAGIISILL